MIESHTYIGPYVIVYMPYTLELTDDCKYHDRKETDNFCPRCGCNKEHRITKRSVPRYEWDWEDKYKHATNSKVIFDDMMFAAVYETKDMAELAIGSEHKFFRVYLPNRYYAELGIDGFNNCGTGHVVIDDIDVNKIKTKFTQIFANELAHIRKYFSAEVRFGVVTYCM